METASRESDEKVERIQRKLDEAILQQQKDKKTNEETLDAFQADIDALEKEKQDLKVRGCGGVVGREWCGVVDQRVGFDFKIGFGEVGALKFLGLVF